MVTSTWSTALSQKQETFPGREQQGAATGEPARARAKQRALQIKIKSETACEVAPLRAAARRGGYRPADHFPLERQPPGLLAPGLQALVPKQHSLDLDERENRGKRERIVPYLAKASGPEASPIVVPQPIRLPAWRAASPGGAWESPRLLSGPGVSRPAAGWREKKTTIRLIPEAVLFQPDFGTM